MTDTELINRLEAYIKENNYLLLHNLTGSDDPAWPCDGSIRGLGLLPRNPRTLRDALESLLRERIEDEDAFAVGGSNA